MGSRVDDLTHPDDAAINGMFLDQALLTGRPFVLQKRYVLKGGISRWVESRYTVLTSTDDKPLVSMICCRIEDPTLRIGVTASDLVIAEYLSDMAGELSRIARASNLPEAGDFLSFAALAARRAMLN